MDRCSGGFEGRGFVNTKVAPYLQQSHIPQTAEFEGGIVYSVSLKDYSYV